MVAGSLRDFVKLIALLVTSAVLEVGEDAGMRTGLQGKQAGFFVGAFLVLAYGLVVNLSKLDFSKLMASTSLSFSLYRR